MQKCPLKEKKGEIQMDKLNRKDKINKYKERKVIGGIYSIKNTINQKILIESTTDLEGIKKRFMFSQQTGSCMNLRLKDDWLKFGGNVFVFEVLEELTKNETQTQNEFREDIKLLKEIWNEKTESEKLY